MTRTYCDGASSGVTSRATYWRASQRARSGGRSSSARDNALAESVIGLYKAEVIHRRGPWRGFDDVEYATLEWVAWFNTQRLLEPLGYVPPAEFEERYYREQAADAALVALNYPNLRETRGGSGRVLG